jgi:hypothetical protein
VQELAEAGAGLAPAAMAAAGAALGDQARRLEGELDEGGGEAHAVIAPGEAEEVADVEALTLDVARMITLKEYVVERWQPSAGPDLEPRTYESYVRLLDDHVLPALGRMRVRDIRVRHVRALLKAKRTEGYAKNTCRLIRAALSTVLTDAVEDEVIEVNPAVQLGRGKKRHAGVLSKGESQQHIRPMDWGQLASFRAEAGGGLAALRHAVRRDGPGRPEARRGPGSRAR